MCVAWWVMGGCVGGVTSNGKDVAMRGLQVKAEMKAGHLQPIGGQGPNLGLFLCALQAWPCGCAVL